MVGCDERIAEEPEGQSDQRGPQCQASQSRRVGGLDLSVSLQETAQDVPPEDEERYEPDDSVV